VIAGLAVVIAGLDLISSLKMLSLMAELLLKPLVGSYGRLVSCATFDQATDLRATRMVAEHRLFHRPPHFGASCFSPCHCLRCIIFVWPE
jgi:hypothetical protein